MSEGLGVDIKEVYSELGGIVSILNRIPIVEGQRVLYEINAQATKPFIREHHLDATLPYDTLITTNDAVRIETTGKIYMVMNKTPDMFENNIVEWNAVLYLCNMPITAHLLRPIEVRDPSSYDMISGWHIVADAPVYGLLTDRIYGSGIDQTSGEGQFPIWRMDLYLPKYYGVKPLDRLVISSTEFYKIEDVEHNNYPGVDVALIVEDTRPKATVVGDEVYDDQY
jgi:hypothetical protein